jgi:hypothetical protein
MRFPRVVLRRGESFYRLQHIQYKVVPAPKNTQETASDEWKYAESPIRYWINAFGKGIP